LVFNIFPGVHIIPIPDIEEQRKYVALYKGLINNQKVYKNSLDDLQLICDTYMDTWKNIENQQPLGELVELVDNRAAIRFHQ
jgi:type I restriction enzyme S subunit